MKRLCAGLALLLAGCAGAEVQGIVRDQSTGEPLEGATVLVGDETTRTDTEGRFELDVDEDDLGRVRVEKPGYRSSTETMPLRGDGDVGEAEHEFRLQPMNEAGAPTSGWSTPRTAEDEGMEGLRKSEDEALRERLKGTEADLRIEPSGK